jgi:predicted dehydrogenase
MHQENGMRFAAVGLDHRHIYHMVSELLAAGADCAGFCPETTDPRVLAGFRERFLDLEPVARDKLFDDPAVDIIACAAVPAERAAIAVRAMRAGKDVMVDKPGVTDEAGLAAVELAVAETGRIFSICFSERFVVPSVEVALDMVRSGAIGRVVQTLGLGPHRLNKAIRPSWFFDRAAFGGILVDIASHQIDQFLIFSGETEATVIGSSVGHFGPHTAPDFEDFGEILLRGAKGAAGYIRVDWFTPDGLPTWGDGRLMILGTEGTIELRKYVDVEGRPGGDHLFLVDARGTRHIDCAREPITYFGRFLADVRDRTETAMSQRHVLTVCRLALDAQAKAARVGERA